MEKREYFSALNEKDAEKYIGKTMEFADARGVRSDCWIKGKLSTIKYNNYPFGTYDDAEWEFCRTCPETFSKKMVKKTVTMWVNRYPSGIAEHAYKTPGIAENRATEDAVEMIQLTGEYEVEECNTRNNQSH